jgi:CheY-like chemotaxis protein
MKKYILLIDDDPDEVDIFSEALREIKKPLACVQASSAKSALNLLNYLIPDYIFLDVNMPGINGLKCLDEIRKIKSIRNIPVILYSNFIDDESVAKALAAGAAACLKKPNQIKNLVEMLDGIFSMNNVLPKNINEREKSN